MRQKYFLSFFLIFAFIPGAFSASAKTDSEKQTHVWFFLFEAGETYALAPFIKEIQQERETYSMKIFAFGSAIDLLKNTGIPLTCPVEDCRAISKSDGLAGIAPTLEWPKDLTVISQGPAKIERELMTLSKEKGAYTIYYDTNFNLNLSEKRKEVLTELSPDEVWISSCHKKEVYERILPGKLLTLVGQPTLTLWRTPLETKKIASMKQKLPMLNIKKDRILLAGSYGPFYENLIEKTLDALSLFGDDIQVFISSHPTRGWTRDSVRLKKRKPPFVHVPKEIRTRDMAMLTDYLLVFRSTIGTQAALAGKPVLFVEYEAGEYEDTALSLGIAKAVSVKELYPTLKKIIFEERELPAVLSQKCIPLNPIKIMKSAISRVHIH